MTLYEIDAAIMDCVDEDTGEIIDPEALDALQMERDQKLEQVALWKKDLEAEAAAIRYEEKNLARRRNAAEKKATDLGVYLSDALDGQKFKTSKVSISFRRTKSVHVMDAGKIPEQFWRQKDPDVDKTEIRKAITSGINVPGAELLEYDSIIVK